MGSGLILLVIVGAWLAVLVPMALRSHDTTSSLSSVDRFSDAMRVLSRREGPSADRRSVVVPRPPAPVRAPATHGSAAGAAGAVPLAVRRRRTLLGLLGAAVLTLLGGLASGALLALHLLVDALLVAFVVHCRRQALLKAARAAGAARSGRPAVPVQRPAQHPGQRPAQAVRPAHAMAGSGVGAPQRMPRRPQPLSAPLPVPAARHDEPVAGAFAGAPVAVSAASTAWVSTTSAPAAHAPAPPAARIPAHTPAAAVGEPWSPVPVPVPTYVTKPVAPARRPRVLDLTKPGEWSATLGGTDAGMDAFDDAGELDGILSRSSHRRAVND